MGGRSQQPHAMRNLFRMDDDSSSSSDNDDDDNVDPNKGSWDMTLSDSSSVPQESTNIRTTTTTTVTQRIHHVELEMCTVGGSIEHRLWPAATFLTSYLLQQQPLPMALNNSNDSHQQQQPHHHHRHHHNSTAGNTVHQQIQQNVQTTVDDFRSILATNTASPNSERRKRFKVLELGAGIGFTSLELAYHAFLHTDTHQRHDIEFLMTDLSSALPLLQRNRLLQQLQLQHQLQRHPHQRNHVWW